MGHVYRGTYKPQGVTQILKLICLDDILLSLADLIRRFEAEAKAASQLDPEHIVIVHDAGASACGTYRYIRMEYLPGGNLQQALDNGTLTPQAALGLMPGLLAGLQHAHDHCIVHRDIKPSNLLLNAAHTALKLADFGIAKSPRPVQTETHTRTGLQLGTPTYTAPELLIDSASASPRSDIYSLGVVLKDIHQAAAKTKTPLPAALSQIADKATAQQPQHRHQTARELQQALEALLQNRASEASALSASAPPAKPVHHPDWETLSPEHQQLLRGTYRDHGDPSRIKIEFDDERITIEGFDLSLNATLADVQFVLGRGRMLEINLGANRSTGQYHLRSLLCVWDELGIINPATRKRVKRRSGWSWN